MEIKKELTIEEIRVLIEHERYSTTPYVGSLISAMDMLMERQEKVIKYHEHNASFGSIQPPAGVVLHDVYKILNGG